VISSIEGQILAAMFDLQAAIHATPFGNSRFFRRHLVIRRRLSLRLFFRIRDRVVCVIQGLQGSGFILGLYLLVDSGRRMRARLTRNRFLRLLRCRFLRCCRGRSRAIILSHRDGEKVGKNRGVCMKVKRIGFRSFELEKN
jgi:hypothetical protein